MELMPDQIAVIGVAYLLGSIPFGYILTRLAGMGDIRAIGSGNIGATNVLRTGNKKLAALTLLLDGVKGAAAVGLAGFVEIASEDLSLHLVSLSALAVLLGHIFPVWLKLKGGKGVATFIGAIMALHWPVGFIVIGVWLFTAKLFRYSSLAALVSIGIAPFCMLIYNQGEVFAVVLAMALLVIMKHHANIRRLLTGAEPKIGAASSCSPAL